MNTISRESFVARHLEEAQARWSPEERRQRAVLGRRRTQELMQLIDGAPSEGDLWAVGSVGADDLARLVG